MFKIVSYVLSVLLTIPSAAFIALMIFSTDDYSDICLLEKIEVEFGEGSNQANDCFWAIEQAKVVTSVGLVILCCTLSLGLFFLYCAKVLAKDNPDSNN